MENTTNYSLKKPQYPDAADIMDINDNMDTIDTEIKARQTAHETHLAETATETDVHSIASIEEKTYYIDAINGDDSNDGLSAGTAFKTWGKANNLIPRYIRHNCVVRIIGNLTENLVVEGKSTDGQAGLNIRGDTLNASNHIVDLFEARNCAGLRIEYLESPARIVVVNSVGVGVRNCNPRNASGDGVAFVNSTGEVLDCDFGNDVVTGDAIRASFSTVFSQNNVGNAGLAGLRSRNASTIGKSGTQPTGNQANEQTETGGVIR